jgi:hypothetical protein
MRRDMTSHVFVRSIVYIAWCCGVLKATEARLRTSHYALCYVRVVQTMGD